MFSNVSSQPIPNTLRQNPNLNNLHTLTDSHIRGFVSLDQNRNLSHLLNLQQIPISSTSFNNYHLPTRKADDRFHSTNPFLPPTGSCEATASGDSDSLPDSQTNVFWFSEWNWLPKPLLQCVSCLLGSEDYKRLLRSRATGGNLHINSVSTIDKFSRVMFPFSFLFINLLYWFSYFFERNSGFLTWEDGKPML